MIRGEVLAEPLDMLAKVAEKACDARAAPAEARNAISRQLLILAQIEPRIAGASAHAFGIGVGAIVNYLGHRHVTFTAAPSDRR